MTQAVRALEIACDSRKQKLYRLNWPLQFKDLKPDCILLQLVEVDHLFSSGKL